MSKPSVSKNKVVLSLWNGRETIEEDLKNGGKRGPSFLIQHSHLVYGDYLRCLAYTETECLEYDFELVQGMVYYDGLYYSDWSCIEIHAFTESECCQIYDFAVFDQEKAIPPKNPTKYFLVKYKIFTGICEFTNYAVLFSGSSNMSHEDIITKINAFFTNYQGETGIRDNNIVMFGKGTDKESGIIFEPYTLVPLLPAEWIIHENLIPQVSLTY